MPYNLEAPRPPGIRKSPPSLSLWSDLEEKYTKRLLLCSQHEYALVQEIILDLKESTRKLLKKEGF